MRREIASMLERLDVARHTSRDQPDGPNLEVVTTVRTGRRGRPKKIINPEWLERVSRFRGKTGISTLVGLSTRTIRRQEIECGLSTPGAAFARRELLLDGTYETFYNTEPVPRIQLDDAEVDTIVASHLKIFPNFGRSMIQGSLQSRGQQLTRRQVRAAYDRLQGGPTQTFSNRRIHRRAYHVAGPNSLWHHDGQHGM
jgi:hypothetical protein